MGSLLSQAFDKYLQGTVCVLKVAFRAAEIAHCVTKKVLRSDRIADTILGPEDDDFEGYVSPTVAPPQRAHSEP